jgi:hypothetical protein
MENQHCQTHEQRELTEAEIDLMDEARAMEQKWNGLIDWLRSTPGIDQREVSIAATEGENAFMRIVRSITRPERIVDMGEQLDGPEYPLTP